ncbi:MAG TPA: hypothetical protein PK419_04610 [Spirochaetota bacterium]|nr:hypothetical protein [Spirochaetota bacterium]HPY03440.1 hypothetical protein [Spirochaetota bacterium]HQA52115.1 hypothetical protein [Spirochaetota bacterium]
MKKYLIFTAVLLLTFQSVFSNATGNKTFSGRVISVNGSELIVKKGKTEKTFSVSDETKIYDENGDIISSDLIWVDKIVKITYNKKTKEVIEIQIIKRLIKESVESTEIKSESPSDKKAE